MLYAFSITTRPILKDDKGYFKIHNWNGYGTLRVINNSTVYNIPLSSHPGFMDPARQLGLPGRQQLCVRVERPLQGLPRGHPEAATSRLRGRPRWPGAEAEQRGGVAAEREPGRVGRLGAVRVPGQHHPRQESHRQSPGHRAGHTDTGRAGHLRGGGGHHEPHLHSEGSV